MRCEGLNRERLKEDQAMLYFTTLAALIIVVDAIHALASSTH
jgi:hypothetical protein